MAEEQQNLEQNQHERPMSFMAMVIWTGFFGGIFWSALGYLCYLLNFTNVSPNVILEPWALGDWKREWLGIVISILAIGVLSIGAALLYYFLLRKIKSMWAGACYGIALFLLVYIVLNPIFPGIHPFWDLSRNTLVASACLYVLYGVFVGYSISYEETELKNNNQVQKEASS
ncbi:YqhR family membrane protein [Bacillus sp. T33-2]|uniref:YqhR family membrane protein n=1 Tax=Bacillus sp. T33-2 TaxID=2054168 RepID=UPI000C77ADDA|nr:YqhR family membrane protein [Bacillus sp. T33-2]PLR99907.1 hypothetical protein CVD19_02315 [Bacillus sp. T33-2]